MLFLFFAWFVLISCVFVIHNSYLIFGLVGRVLNVVWYVRIKHIKGTGFKSVFRGVCLVRIKNRGVSGIYDIVLGLQAFAVTFVSE